jgi:5-methylcytosine-specific restriction endonuclease McrA
MDTKILTNAEAKALGLKKYFSGKPCPKGHTAERYVGGSCVVCGRLRASKTYEENKPARLAYEKERYQINKNDPEFLAKEKKRKAEYRETHKEKLAKKNSEYQRVNPDKCRIRSRRHYANNKRKENMRSAMWRKENKDLVQAYVSERRAMRKTRMPKDMATEYRWFFKEAHDLAKLRSELTNVDWQVDHIVPLKGDGVSGLHVPWNIQIIPAAENIAKRNYLPPEDQLIGGGW